MGKLSAQERLFSRYRLRGLSSQRKPKKMLLSRFDKITNPKNEKLESNWNFTSIGAAFEGLDDVLKEIHGLRHARIALSIIISDHPMESNREIRKFEDPESEIGSRKQIFEFGGVRVGLVRVVVSEICDLGVIENRRRRRR